MDMNERSKSREIALVSMRRTSSESPIQQDEGSSSEGQYLGPKAMALLVAGLMMAMFVVALDNTIIATAIPKLATDFDALLDIGWYGSVYILCTVSLQPTFGKIYTFWNVKHTFLAAILIFEIGSVLCATATSSKMFIVGRAIAGCGAAGIYSGVMTIVGYRAPPEKRPAFIAMVVSMFAVSAIVGPLIGGALTDKVSWRWCFWLNPFIGSVGAVAVIFCFTSPKREVYGLTFVQKVREVDVIGSVLLVGACFSLLIALQQGGAVHPWTDARIWGPLAIGFPVLLSAFIIQQIRRGEKSVIPPSIFLQRTVLASCVFAFFQMATVFVHVFYLPIYFQAIQGVDALRSGIRSIPYLVANVVPAIVVACVLPKVGYYTPFMIAGGIFAVIGSGLLYTLRVDSSAGQWIGYQVVAGFGVGLSAQLPIVAIQATISPEDYPTGNAIYLFFQNIGGSITISIAQTILQNGLESEISKFAPQVSAPVVIAAGATKLRQLFPAQVLSGILQAYMKAINLTFTLPIATAALTLVSACFVDWKSVKGQKLGVPA